MSNERRRAIIEIFQKKIGHGWARLLIRYTPALIDMKRGITLDYEDIGIKVYTNPANANQEKFNRLRYSKANSLLDKRRSEFDNGRIRLPSEDFISFYRHLASSMGYNLTASLKQLIKFTGERCAFDRINAGFIAEYQTFLECKASTSKGDLLANSTVLLYMRQMLFVCRTAISKGFISEDDIAGAGLPRYPDDDCVVSFADLRKLYRYPERDHRVEKLLNLHLLTGLPVSYLLRLEVKDLTSDDFGNWSLDIKGKRGKRTYISSEAAEIIRQCDNEGHVFQGMSYPEANSLLTQWTTNAGLTKSYRFHNFRIQLDSLDDIFLRKPRES